MQYVVTFLDYTGGPNESFAIHAPNIYDAIIDAIKKANGDPYCPRYYTDRDIISIIRILGD